MGIDCRSSTLIVTPPVGVASLPVQVTFIPASKQPRRTDWNGDIVPGHAMAQAGEVGTFRGR
jgi:hypothetical protein